MDEAERRIQEVARSGVIDLDLSGLGLTALPRSLFELAQVQHRGFAGGKRAAPVVKRSQACGQLDGAEGSAGDHTKRGEVGKQPQRIWPVEGTDAKLVFVVKAHAQITGGLYSASHCPLRGSSAALG